jgi:hypothetical protein
MESKDNSMKSPTFIDDCNKLKDRLFQQVKSYNIPSTEKITKKQIQEKVFEQLKNRSLSYISYTPPLNLLDMVCDISDIQLKEHKLKLLSDEMLVYIHDYYTNEENRDLSEMISFLLKVNPYPSLEELRSYSKSQLRTLFKINRLSIGDADTKKKLVSKFISCITFIGYKIIFKTSDDVDDIVKIVDIFSQEITLNPSEEIIREEKKVSPLPKLKVRRKR